MTLEQLLVLHSAPTLAGMKSASLICLNLLDAYGRPNIKALQNKGLSFFALRNRKGCRLLLVYREKQVLKAMHNGEATVILEERGYDISNVGSAPERLKERFLSEDFPHEVGIFLGYPVCDVKGFIENSGRNFIISDLWKVYDEKENAVRMLDKYRKCSMVYKSCFENGTGIERLCVTA